MNARATWGMLLLLLASTSAVAQVQPLHFRLKTAINQAVTMQPGSAGLVTWRLTLVGDMPGVSRESAVTAAAAVASCFSQPGVLKFTKWDGQPADALPFAVVGSVRSELAAGTDVRLIVLGAAPAAFQHDMTILPGHATEGCKGVSVTAADGTPVKEMVEGTAGIKARPLKFETQLGAGARSASLGFDGYKVTGSDASGSVSSLETSGRVPLGKPDDVRNAPGAQKDASKEIADAVTLAWNTAHYKPGGKLVMTGIRLRATGSLKGAEVTGYWAPYFGWFHDGHGFYGAEAEAGWRRGDAEFTSLRTRQPDIGHSVLRVGAVAEWAPPEFCLAKDQWCVNRNLSTGLRYFVRGRVWIDSYKEQGASTRVRVRPFIDSELFWNYTADARVFLRAEAGYLPPDLSTRSRRVFVGVGQAF